MRNLRLPTVEVSGTSLPPGSAERGSQRSTEHTGISMSDTILVTGGAGFIGSHTCVALAAAGYLPLVLDNLGNSDLRVLDRLERITGRRPGWIEGDVRDRALLDRVFTQHRIAGVIHFAGLKAVGDSVADPIGYYDNNVHGTWVLA